MGNNTSRNSGSGNRSGLTDHCYRVGYDHARNRDKPDPVGEGIDSFPCTLNTDANKAYANGIVDGMRNKDTASNQSGSSGSAYTDRQRNLQREIERRHRQSNKNPNRR